MTAAITFTDQGFRDGRQSYASVHMLIRNPPDIEAQAPAPTPTSICTEFGRQGRAVEADVRWCQLCAQVRGPSSLFH